MKSLSKTVAGLALGLSVVGFMSAAQADTLTYYNPWVPGTFYGGPTLNGQVFDINNDVTQYFSDTTGNPATPQAGDTFDDFFVFNSVPSVNSAFQLIMSSLGSGTDFTGLNIWDAGFTTIFDTESFGSPQTSFDFSTTLAGGEYALELTGDFLQNSGTYAGYIGENIPEPASLALVGLGLAAALTVRRRAQRG